MRVRRAMRGLIFDGFPDALEDFREGEAGFLDVLFDAHGAEAFDFPGAIFGCAEDDDGEGGGLGVGAEAVEDFFAAHAGHHEVEDHEVHGARLEELEGFLAAAGAGDFIAAEAEQARQRFASIGRVIDQEDVASILHWAVIRCYRPSAWEGFGGKPHLPENLKPITALGGQNGEAA